MKNNIIFNKDDYESNDGMMTYIWGPSLWFSLHIISFNYPVKPTLEQKKYYFKFYYNLQNILPCKSCRDNLKKKFKKSPLTLNVFKNRETLSKYIYELHEHVNDMLGKKSNLTYEQVRDRYELFRSRCILSDEIKSKNKEECIIPLYKGEKSKCILNIIPLKSKQKTFNIDPACYLKKIN